MTPECLRLTRRTRSPCACRRGSSRGRRGRAGRCTGRDSRRTQGALDVDLACIVCRVPERGRARQCARASSLLRVSHRGAERARRLDVAARLSACWPRWRSWRALAGSWSAPPAGPRTTGMHL
jgi:hypothetical protein